MFGGRESENKENSALYFSIPLHYPWKITHKQTIPLSWSCDRAKFSGLCVKSWDLHAQTKEIFILTSFTVFSSSFTHIKWFWVILFAHFHAQNFKTKVLTARKIYFRMSDIEYLAACFRLLLPLDNSTITKHPGSSIWPNPKFLYCQVIIL